MEERRKATKQSMDKYLASAKGKEYIETMKRRRDTDEGRAKRAARQREWRKDPKVLAKKRARDRIGWANKAKKAKSSNLKKVKVKK